MWIHYLKTAALHFRKHLSFSLINLFGLAISMAVCIMIFLFVQRELGFDRFHPNASEIHRLYLELDIQGDIRIEPVTSHAIGPDLLMHFPEVKDMTRVSHWDHPVSVWQDDSYRMVSHAMFAESSFFRIFSFPLIKGDAKTALEEPFSLVLTQGLARELFPEKDPMGQVVQLGNEQQSYRITGVAADVPPNSHLYFDMLRSYPSIRQGTATNYDQWDSNLNAFTYVRLAEDTDMEALREKTDQLAFEKVNYKYEGMGVRFGVDYFPVTRLRLHGDFGREMVETATLGKVWAFIAVAVFVLFIAAFNYVNLSIARSGKRAREVGIRKVLGADSYSLRKLFFLDALMVTAAGMVLGLLLAEALLPVFGRLLDAGLSLLQAPWWFFLAAFLLFSVFFGLFAGSYPAWIMSSIQPVQVLKGSFWSRPGRWQLKNLLLIIQFIVSMGLVVCTLVVFLQVRHLRGKDLGFQSEGLLAVQIDRLEDAQVLKNTLMMDPGVLSMSVSSARPGTHIYMEGVELEHVDPGIMSQRLWVDQAFYETMQLSLKQGRWFDRDDGLALEHAVVNQALVRKAGWTEPLGKIIGRGEGDQYRIIGVVHDFYFQSLHREVEPLLINVHASLPWYMNIPYWVTLRSDESALPPLTERIHEVWMDLFPTKTFDYYFVAEVMDGQYAGERHFGYLFMGLTLLAVFIAMLGVMGLSAYSALQRLRETGIRKVMGATVFQVLGQMASAYLKGVLIAALFAFPISYWYMDRWLAGFPYAIDFPWWTMPAALLGVIVITLAIVISQSVYIARANPVNVLKTE